MAAPLSRSLALLALTIALCAHADNWPRFRGPNGSGHAQGDLPGELTPAHRKWSVKLPGVGHGSPAVWDDRVFVLCSDPATGKRLPTCVRAGDGKILWQLSFDAPINTHHKFNSLATSTPAVDAQRVYFTWGVPEKLTLFALTHDGKPAWEADLGPVKREHGFGSSPIVVDDLVILSNDQETDSHLFAVEAKTGKVRWKLPQTPPGSDPPENPVSYQLNPSRIRSPLNRPVRRT